MSIYSVDSFLSFLIISKYSKIIKQGGFLNDLQKRTSQAAVYAEKLAKSQRRMAI